MQKNVQCSAADEQRGIDFAEETARLCDLRTANRPLPALNSAESGNEQTFEDQGGGELCLLIQQRELCAPDCRGVQNIFAADADTRALIDLCAAVGAVNGAGRAVDILLRCDLKERFARLTFEVYAGDIIDAISRSIPRRRKKWWRLRH